MIFNVIENDKETVAKILNCIILVRQIGDSAYQVETANGPLYITLYCSGIYEGYIAAITTTETDYKNRKRLYLANGVVAG